MFTLESVKWLASAEGERVLARLADENLSDDHTLRLITLLRRDLPAEQAGAALELARLRVKAADKFGADAGKLFFTREALEQASHPAIRQVRAHMFPSARAGQRLIDVCCGIGSDAFAFAAQGWQVTGYDLDPVRVEMARLNAQALNLNIRFETADVTALSLVADAAFFDPARRDAQGKRIFDVERYQPPLSLVDRFEVAAWMAKLSPGIDMAQIERWMHPPVLLTFFSVRGDLKEATLSAFDETAAGGVTAILIGDQPDHIETWSKDGETETVIAAPRRWLVEPDPALIRAGLVADAAHRFNGAQLDDSIAYFTTDDAPRSAWVRAWRVLDWMPFNLKKLRAYLRERGVGTVTVKKRGTAVTPETLIAQLKLTGSESRTLVLTRYQGRQIVLICEDYAP